MIQEVLLATDGSAAAERAIQFSASLSVRFHSRVIALHAYLPPAGNPPEPGQVQAFYETREAAWSVVTGAARRLRALGVEEVETEVREGPAASVILGVADSRQPDLLIIGARGLSTWQGAALGSVCLAVVQRADCPVLVIK